ncbi:Mth938-like domain-containing protein [Alkalilimnicola ehrlichii]|uniref:Mth938-like domain-containing protein n=1 Tax=Alkalilimnicola ehrlichii TaxID=351052 RepID=UPI003BA0EB8D
MKITQEYGTARYRIRAYQPGEVQINDQCHRNSLILGLESLITDWGPESLDQLTAEHMEAVLSLAPEVIILGTGERQRFPSREIMLPLLREGIGVEVMANDAACRTYNILMSEDRRVALALILTD